MADFCPFVQEFTWKGGPGAGAKENGEAGRGTRCDNPDNTPNEGENFALEYYGAESKCFKQVNLGIISGP